MSHPVKIPRSVKSQLSPIIIRVTEETRLHREVRALKEACEKIYHHPITLIFCPLITNTYQVSYNKRCPEDGKRADMIKKILKVLFQVNA
jgi:hypothetical protein